MVEAVVGPCVEKLVDYTIAPISRQFKYMFRYNRNIQNLRSKAKDLENKRNDVQLSVDGAKNNALVIKSEVDAWLKKVDDLKKEADEFLDSTTNSEMRCLRCPNLKTRYVLSRNATKKTTAIVELRKEGEFDEVGVRAPLKFTSSHGPEALKTRISTKMEIINALKDSAISTVGICGMPGVGKTRMAQEVMTQVHEDKLFDEVAMAVVSKDVDIIRIQDELAEMLSLRIEEKTNKVVRAARLNDRFTQDNKKRILVILDDLWTHNILETIGIPSLNRPVGLKILLTSRFEYVFRKLGVQRNIEVGVLPREEAFALFQEISMISNDDTQLKAIAEQVAEECKGLPLALEAVGKKLRNSEVSELHVWRDELNRLQHSQHHHEVYSSIQLSYNNLESDEHRSFLLLCSLFPEDESIPIESLVRYARGLRLFENTETLSKTRDRADTISDTLKSCHLLLSDKKKEEVTLHDVIRDFCIWVASKGEHRYMAKHDLRTEWPEHDAHGTYSAISLSFQEAIELPSRLRYGNLKLLGVNSKMQIPNEFFDDMQELGVHFSGAQIRPPIQIPKEFFDDMQELRVLHISGAQIRSPIQLPMGLRTLNLNYCTLEIEISLFRSLNKLEILTFYRSSLSTDFPRNEMVELSNLKLLDLRFNEDSCPPPPGFLFGKTKLEELYLGNYYSTSHDEKEKELIIEELRSLKALNTLQIRTDDTQFLMQLLQACSEKLERFEIVKNRRQEIFPRFYFYPEWIDRALKEKVWEKRFSELVQDFRINLNKLELNNLDSEYLIDSVGSFPRGIFCNLEFLELSKMKRLKEMCKANFQRMKHSTRGVSQPALFCNLKDLRVYNCAEIERMFYESVAKRMGKLENLSIFSCQSLEEVVSVDTQENEITELPLFPKLKKVHLRDLKSFVSLRSQALLNQVILPDLEGLEIDGLGCIEKLLSVEETPFGSLNRLRRVRVKSCHNLVNIAQSYSIKLLQNVNKDNKEEISMLDEVKSLDLMEDDYLVHIMVPKGIRVFQNLKWLNVAFCSKLKYLFPASMINSFVALETLYVRFCDKMEEIFGREEEVVKEEGMAGKIVFRELKHIELIGLPRFNMFCSYNYELVFPSLDLLRIEGCPVMKIFRSGQLNAPKLKEVLIGDDEVTDISNVSEW